MKNKSTNVRTKQEREGYRPQAAAWLGRVSRLHPALGAWLATYWFTRPRHWPRPEWERQILRTGTSVSLRGGVTAWSFGSGPPVILVHGWEGRGSQLGAFVEPLVEHGYRVLTFDVAAHGSSPGTHATILSWLPPLFELAERFGDPVGIIAHSFGCPAVSLALRRGLNAACAIYIAPPDALDGSARTFAGVTGMGDAGARALQRRLTRITGLDFDEQRVEKFGPAMRIPLLVVHDEQDRDVRIAAAASYARWWPGARVFTTRDLGHRKVLRAPQVIGRVVDFLVCRQYPEASLDRWFSNAQRRGAPSLSGSIYRTAVSTGPQCLPDRSVYRTGCSLDRRVASTAG